MKKKLKRGVSGLLAALLTLTAVFGGGVTAFAASPTGATSESYSVDFPRDGDSNQIYSEDVWGHSARTYMNGWSSFDSTTTTVHCMDSFDGQVVYCIEPGISRSMGETFTGSGEDFWDNYPSSLNHTIKPDEIKVLLGRIMQYGYQGNISTSWRSQNAADADRIAHAYATQILVWETIVGERDANFNHVSTGGYDTVKSIVSTGHPLYKQVCHHYDSIVSGVQSHTVVPSFMTRSAGNAQNVELEWDGSQYSATLTDANDVLSRFRFTANVTGVNCSVSGNQLTITAKKAPADAVQITATRNQMRSGVIVWTDGNIGGGQQDTVTYSASVSDPVAAYLNLKVSYGAARIVKTAEDGKVNGIAFTITGEGINRTVTTDQNGEVQIDNLKPGVYTVTEQVYDQYEPQEVRHVTVVSGRTATVSFNNTLKRGSVQLTKVDKDYPDNHLTGAEFEVYRDNELVGTLEELSDGVYRLDDLPYGDYTLKETKAPAGFCLDEQTYAFSITENGVTVLVENEAGRGFANAAQTGSLRIEKTSEDGKLQGFTFRVTGTDITGKAFSKDYVTDENGQIKIDGLRIGDYVVSEVSNEANKAYILPSDVTVTVNDGKTSVAKFHNQLKPVTDIPKTGDSTNLTLWAALAGASLLGAGAAAFFTFRMKKEDRHER